MLCNNINSSYHPTVLTILVLTVAFSANLCNSARILGFFPAPSQSHLIIHTAIMEALAERGHNVTIFQTMSSLKRSHESTYNTVNIDLQAFDENFLYSLINKPPRFHNHLGTINYYMTKHANLTLSHPKTQQFLRDYKKSFDLVILGYFLNDYYLGLGAHFNCPLILSFTIQPTFSINNMVGNPMEVAYVPSLFGGLKQPLNFVERLQNFLRSAFEEIVTRTLIKYRIDEAYNAFFPADRYPSLDDMYRNISLVLSNYHFSQGTIRPNVPAIIDIGGIQIKEKPDPLPTEIQSLLDNATQGAIYFSLGSHVEGSHLPTEKTQAMFDVLSSLPYQVLWKWGEEVVPGRAKNIFFQKWLPQDDILAHPHVKLFITHGGQGSLVESEYHGVPMVGIPLFGDQPTNMVNVVSSGFGVKVDYNTLSADSFRSAILEVLENPKYRDAVQKFSTVYRDRPMTARQTAVYWTEYVLRHRGAKHLQSPAVYLNVWQRKSLDVIGFLLAMLAVLCGVLWAIYKGCRRGKMICIHSERENKEKKQ